MRAHITHLLRKATRKWDKYHYKNSNFVVVSNNCWGGEIYKRLGLEYNTPFIDLFIFGPDYLKLLENFDQYMQTRLSFEKKSKWLVSPVSYPIGTLRDVEIHFLHYRNNKEVFDKWNRRLERMYQIDDRDRYFFKIDDRDLSTSNIIIQYHQLSFKNKISFSIGELDIKGHIAIKEHENHQFVPDGLKLYRCCFKYIDVFRWLDTGIISYNIYTKLKSAADIA